MEDDRKIIKTKTKVTAYYRGNETLESSKELNIESEAIEIIKTIYNEMNKYEYNNYNEEMIKYEYDNFIFKYKKCVENFLKSIIIYMKSRRNPTLLFFVLYYI